jgi:hypothetical protein
MARREFAVVRSQSQSHGRIGVSGNGASSGATSSAVAQGFASKSFVALQLAATGCWQSMMTRQVGRSKIHGRSFPGLAQVSEAVEFSAGRNPTLDHRVAQAWRIANNNTAAIWLLCVRKSRRNRKFCSGAECVLLGAVQFVLLRRVFSGPRGKM